MTLIGIAGPARSGKDSAADVLVREFGFTRYALADPIKAGVRVMFGLTDDHTDGEPKEVVLPDLGVSPRHLMQTLGTEWGRNTVRDDLWLRVADRVLAHIDGPVVVPDIRLENEAEWVRSKGGTLWHIERGEAPTVRAHVTENGVARQAGEPVIVNDGTLAELRAQVVDTLADAP